MTEIILDISRRYQVKPCDLLSKKRKIPLPQARHQCFAMSWAGGWTQIEIAELFDISQSAISKAITNYYQTENQ